MIDTSPDRDWGPSPDEVLRIARLSGCTVELGEALHDGTRAYRLACPSHAAKVRLLANLGEYDSRHPEIVRLGERLAAYTNGEPAGTAALVHAFVRDGVRHVPEPTEKFQPAGRTLAMGVGDCDDSARAVFALLRAAGLRAGLLTLGEPPRHVAAGVQLGGAWHWLDASLSAAAGEHPLAAAKRLGLTVRPELGDLGQAGEKEPAYPNVPNLITIAGFGMGLAWYAGKGDVWGVASIIADELDGWVARQLDQTTQFGSLLDWGTDLALTPLAWLKVGLPIRFLPLLTAAQIGMRHYGWAPRIGSLRALLMAADIGRNQIRKRRRRR